MSVPLAEGYILVDSRKCQGCQRCMMACSLAHYGESNLSLSRIQVMQNILRNWPDDILISQCRQCVNSRCLRVCPTGALYIDINHGNIRIIDETKGNGCCKCIDACPFIPSRVIWNHLTGKAIKCDLCVDTPYWKETGGPEGSQLCVQICPQNAIVFTRDTPVQRGDTGYNVDLKGEV